MHTLNVYNKNNIFNTIWVIIIQLFCNGCTVINYNCYLCMRIKLNFL